MNMMLWLGSVLSDRIVAKLSKIKNNLESYMWKDRTLGIIA